jgi:hypothetical protein
MEIVSKNTSLYVQQRFVVQLCSLLLSYKLHDTQYTPQLETHFTTTLLNI